MGIWLAVHSDIPGWRAPLALLGLLWLAFTLAGWQRARLGDYRGHRRTMTRSYATALAFLSTRLLVGPFGPLLFGVVTDPALRAATAMWVGVVAPLLLLEAWWGGTALLRASRAAANQGASGRLTRMSSSTS